MKWMWLVMVVCAACGEPSPKEKCEDLGDRFCDRAVECIPGAQGMHEQCFDAYKRGDACEAVKTVTSSYEACMDDLDRFSCQALFGPMPSFSSTVSLPGTCQGVLRGGVRPAPGVDALRAAMRAMPVR
jgi:hypothetical protein